MKHIPLLDRRGYTLAELAIVVAIMGLATVAGVRGLTAHLDRLAVRNAVDEAAGALARARDEALALHALVSVRIDTADATITLRTGARRLARYAIGHEHGVTLTTTRDSISFDVRGLGFGAANLTLVARRGSAADTLVVSRLGRVRR
ncbi:MAG TPA: GspH/FimT family pseudopilin [Gemmatimonadaceae bacterium]|nr:GspH/FimT family pseudopilin [Gemmatimonadaceae bacterium]